MHYILSADIGTSSLKAAFIDPVGHLSAFSRVVFDRTDYARDGASTWEKSFAQALEFLFEQKPNAKIDGVCISGNGPTLVPVTANGESFPPLYWYDGKTVLPPDYIKTPSFFLSKAAWLK
ncbi:MAG: hypothetical protein LBH42_01965, partial [Treponema sp.]|nr:hypothetical protein [Treponema sp.]